MAGTCLEHQPIYIKGETMITILLNKMGSLKMKGFAIFGLLILTRTNIESAKLEIDFYEVVKAATSQKTYFGKLEVYYD